MPAARENRVDRDSVDPRPKEPVALIRLWIQRVNFGVDARGAIRHSRTSRRRRGGSTRKQARPVIQIPLYMVEDDPAVSLSLGALLRADNLLTHHFVSADLFLEAIDAIPPGCVLMDIHMAGTDGLAALQLLRERGKPWPVIVMTGCPDDRTEALARECGAVAFLYKPFGREELLRAIDDVMPMVPLEAL
jgi:CheY-like chemotaxis protein